MKIRVLRSSAFRLLMAYIVIFGLSAALLLFVIYAAMMREMDDQIKRSINIQLANLGRQLITDGPRDAAAAIGHLVRNDVDGAFVYLLLDGRWRIKAGNLDLWPGGSTTEEEWVTFTPRYHGQEKDPADKAIARTTSLPDKYLLLVGYNLRHQERMENILKRVLSTGFFLMLGLGAGGGLLLAWSIQRRVEAVNRVCARVAEGHMEERVPTSGANDEFDHLASHVNTMLIRIGELVEGVRAVSSSIAHDLRTPLGRLRNRVEEIALRPDIPAAAGQAIEKALREVDGVMATFDAILRISQAESGAGAERFEVFSLSQAIMDVLELYEALAEEKNILILYDIAQDANIRGDRHLLAQAFANIVDNAIKYSPEGGEVKVVLGSDGQGGVVFTVSDHGSGIPHEFYDKVTDRFFRLETSRHTKGSGLGLSLAKAAITLHRGSLEFADNAPGLRVTVRLPASR